MFKWPGGNPLAPDHGLRPQGELRAVTVSHPDGKHFSRAFLWNFPEAGMV